MVNDLHIRRLGCPDIEGISETSGSDATRSRRVSSRNIMVPRPSQNDARSSRSVRLSTLPVGLLGLQTYTAL